MQNTAKAPGKIILTGEYAVVFGEPGIAIPANIGLTATFTQNLASSTLHVEWPDIENEPEWQSYLQQIITLCSEHDDQLVGTLTIDNAIPLGKGMGSSTALVIAVTKALLGEDCMQIAMHIEDTVNPGHSGLDFAVIWHEKPVLFRKGDMPECIELPDDLLENSELIDSGRPNETTPELVAYVESCLTRRRGDSRISPTAETEEENQTETAIQIIGNCTKALIEKPEDLHTIIKTHHQAQCALGIVPPKVQELIKKFEQEGRAAKVIGAGGRTGGGGMVLVLAS